MQMKTMKAEEEAKRIRQMLTRINSWMDRVRFPLSLKEEVETKVQEKLQENKNANLEIVLTLLSPVHRRWYEIIKNRFCSQMLKKLSVFKVMDEHVLYGICQLMKMVEYSENTLIVKKDEPLDRMVLITEGSMGVHTSSMNSTTLIRGSLDECRVYGHEELVSWALSTNANLDCLPISKETMKCRTKVEGFVLKASDLKKVLPACGVIQDNDSDQDHVEISNSIEGGSSSSLTSTILVATTAAHFRRRLLKRLRRAKPALHLDFDPSSYRGM